MAAQGPRLCLACAAGVYRARCRTMPHDQDTACAVAVALGRAAPWATPLVPCVCVHSWQRRGVCGVRAARTASLIFLS